MLIIICPSIKTNKIFNRVVVVVVVVCVYVVVGGVSSSRQDAFYNLLIRDRFGIYCMGIFLFSAMGKLSHSTIKDLFPYSN